MRFVLVTAVASAMFSADALAAQAAPRTIELPPATATHSEEFTLITSLRELSDGRVLVTDGREQRLLVLNFADGSSEAFGRRGGGPNEYQMLGRLYATRGDSSMMSDFAQRRWLLLDGARIVATIPNDNPAVQALPESFFYGADARGRVLGLLHAERRDGRTETGKEDSTTVVLVDRLTGRTDTIARTMNAERVIEIQRNSEGRIMRSSNFGKTRIFDEETAILLNDGTVAVVRLNPFRVDWRAPDGRWTRGAPAPVARIRMDAREREAFEARNRPAPGAPAMPPGFAMPTELPDLVPIFAPGQVQAGPDGTVLIRRSRSADFTGNHYFVFDRVRGFIGEIGLPIEKTIVGAGPNSLYVTNRDADDILRLTRHPWPNR